MRDAQKPGTIANRLGHADVEEGDSDTLAIALASYFERHKDRPANDPDDDETGWSEWVMKKTYTALERVADQITI